MADVQLMALMKKVHSQVGAEHPAGTGQPIEQGCMTAWDEQLAKFENTSIGAKNRRYRPGGSLGIRADNSNSGDQVSCQMFKPGVDGHPGKRWSGLVSRQEQRGTGPAWRPGLGLIATTSGHP